MIASLIKGRHNTRLLTAYGTLYRALPGYVEALASRIPLGRMAGDHEAADAVLFLCSDAAAYITGASLPVDGGSSIPQRALPDNRREQK